MVGGLSMSHKEQSGVVSDEFEGADMYWRIATRVP